MATSLRRRIEQSDRIAAVIGWIIAGWLRFCFATSRWDRRGDEDIVAALKNGPVLVVMWHEHIMMAGLNWRQEWRPAAILTDTSPAARVARAVQRNLDLTPFPISTKASNISAVRGVLAIIRSGTSLGLTGDGPRGPARRLNEAPVEWARATGVPVFVYAFAMRRQVRLRSWDRMVLPLPFTRAASVYERWNVDVPRRASAEETARLRDDLEQLAVGCAARAEGLVGRSG